MLVLWPKFTFISKLYWRFQWFYTQSLGHIWNLRSVCRALYWWSHQFAATASTLGVFFGQLKVFNAQLTSWTPELRRWRSWLRRRFLLRSGQQSLLLLLRRREAHGWTNRLHCSWRTSICPSCSYTWCGLLKFWILLLCFYSFFFQLNRQVGFLDNFILDLKPWFIFDFEYFVF